MDDNKNNEIKITLHVIRHGQTDYNKVHRVQGSMDIELNETGKGQATSKQKLYSQKNIDYIYFISSLLRFISSLLTSLAYNSM